MIEVGVGPRVHAPAPAVPRGRSGARVLRALRVRRPSLISLAVLLVLTLCTVALALTARVLNQQNEQRLLTLQVRQAAGGLETFLPKVQTPLTAAAEIAAADRADPVASVRSYLTRYVGPDASLDYAALWRVDGADARLVTSLGSHSRLAGRTLQAGDFVSGAIGTSALNVIAMPAGTHAHMGYAMASSDPTSHYVVYGESVLKPKYHTNLDPDSPFLDLHFAIYTGPRATPAALLETNVADLPMPQPSATVVVPFGTGQVTVVASPVSALGGQLSEQRWWIILVLGLILSVGASVMTNRLVRRRIKAERLAGEVETLLADQRTIAETLQRSLLPADLPDVPELAIATRYLPGVNGVEIGGDWYDVIAVDERHVFFVVGDVSGRGVEAGAVMASLHFAIRGFVSEGHDPATVLDLLSRLLNLTRDRRFATVLCGLADTRTRTVTLANAGHLPPLLVDASGAASFLTVPTGPPIGIGGKRPYRSTTVQMADDSTLVMYTDGLVERRDESIDDGLERLRSTAARLTLPLDRFVGTLVSEVAERGADDTAVLGLQWRPATVAVPAR